MEQVVAVLPPFRGESDNVVGGSDAPNLAEHPHELAHASLTATDDRARGDTTRANGTPRIGQVLRRSGVSFLSTRADAFAGLKPRRHGQNLPGTLGFSMDSIHEPACRKCAHVVGGLHNDG